MSKNKSSSITKKDIINKIQKKTGFSHLYVSNITNDFIKILKILIKENNLNIKNFGNFKIISKKKRIGRNPKNNKNYLINSRKSLTFNVSKNLNLKINN